MFLNYMEKNERENEDKEEKQLEDKDENEKSCQIPVTN